MRAFLVTGSGRTATRFALLALIIAAGIVATFAHQASGRGYYVDLVAFYCGGSSLLHHADPYTTIAAACTQAIKAGAAPLRAPHPPFALIVYALMAMLPFHVVTFAYVLLAWLAIGATAFVLSRFVAVDAWIVALGLAPLGYYCIAFGQPTPFVALFVASCAYALVRERFVAAALCAAATLVFPQVGLPVVLALFVCRPATRAALIVSVAALAVAGLAVLGPAANVHYVTVSLKLEQLQTAGDALQYGLPWLLQQLHVPPSIAAGVGTTWYLVVLVTGILWLRRFATTAPALIALVPPALVAMSSSFVHLQHFALALPLAMFLLGSGATAPVLLGTALLAIPWADSIIGSSAVHDGVRALSFAVLGTLFASCVVCFDAPLARRRALLVWLVAIASIYAIVLVAIALTLGGVASVDEPPSTLATLSFKLPTIAGLLLVVGYGLKREHHD